MSTDGWSRSEPLTVQLGTEGQEETLETTTDEFGRFEFASVKPGSPA